MLDLVRGTEAPSDAWLKEMKILFGRDAPPATYLANCTGLIDLATRLKIEGDDGPTKVRSLLLEAVDTANREDPRARERASRAAALAFLGIGPPPSDDDRSRITAHNQQIIGGVADGTLAFRDSWAQISYRRVIDPEFSGGYTERAGRDLRSRRGEVLAEAIQALEARRAPGVIPTRPKLRQALVRFGPPIAVAAILSWFFLSPYLQEDSSRLPPTSITPTPEPSIAPTPYWAATDLAGWDQPECGTSAFNDEEPTERIVVLVGQGGCLVDSIRANPALPLDVVISYRNLSTKQADNVTFLLEVGEGLSLVPETSYWSNASHPNGVVTSDAVTGPGLNLGSYSHGANVWFVARLAFDESVAECEAQDIYVHGYVLSDVGREDGTGWKWEGVRVRVPPC